MGNCSLRSVFASISFTYVSKLINVTLTKLFMKTPKVIIGVSLLTFSFFCLTHLSSSSRSTLRSAQPTTTMFRIATNPNLSGPIRRSIQSKSRRIFSTGGKPEPPANSAKPQATPPPPAAPAPSKEGIKYAKTSAGTGAPDGAAGGGGGAAFSTRGPVTWPALGLVAIAAGSAVAYYRIERERRLENAMGKIVSDNLSASALYRIL